MISVWVRLNNLYIGMVVFELEGMRDSNDRPGFMDNSKKDVYMALKTYKSIVHLQIYLGINFLCISEHCSFFQL